jgi:hypothetical protein
MRRTSRLPGALAWVAIFALVVPAAHGQPLPDADSREVQNYMLTEAALARYTQATRSLNGVRFQDCDEDSDVRSLAEAAAKIEAEPRAMAAVQAAGMTSREYVVFVFSLVQNGLASYSLETPGAKLPAGISMANVEFFRRHSAALEKLAAETEVESCGEEAGD